MSTRTTYYPFGETSFGSYAKKRYQYVGKERDEESGLYYYGARYFSPWIARFISCDPLSSKYAQLSPYNYADNNPINDYDIDGMQTASSVESQQSGPVKNPFPAAKDANGNIVTNQETGEAIRPSTNEVEVHYTEPKDPMQPASTMLSLPDLKNPYKAANIVPVIKGNFDVAPPTPQRFYFEKPASKEIQNHWKSFYAKFGYAHSNQVYNSNTSNSFFEIGGDISIGVQAGIGVKVNNSKLKLSGNIASVKLLEGKLRYENQNTNWIANGNYVGKNHLYSIKQGASLPFVGYEHSFDTRGYGFIKGTEEHQFNVLNVNLNSKEVRSFKIGLEASFIVGINIYVEIGVKK